MYEPGDNEFRRPEEQVASGVAMVIPHGTLRLVLTHLGIF